MLKYKILPNKSQPVLCVLTMMLCNVYSKFSEADLLPSYSLQLSMRNETECQPGKFMMIINLVENADFKCMQWTGTVDAWMWKWIFQWASRTVSRFTLKERDDKVTSTVQNALLTVLLGRQCSFWLPFHGIHKTQDGRNSISIIDTGI